MTLAIQGPPGTGKTYAGARMVLALAAAGKTVGVTGDSHKVIGNVLGEVHRAAGDAGLPGAAISVGQKPGRDEPPTCPDERDLGKWDRGRIAAGLADGSLHVAGDGVMSLANTVAVSPAARSLVLLGDPQQLDQPLEGSPRPAPSGMRSAISSPATPASRPTPRCPRAQPGVRLLRGSGIRWLTVKHAANAVDGVEAPRSIYAMGSSSPEDAPRGMEFLDSLNRLNVAASRGRCIAAVVATDTTVVVATVAGAMTQAPAPAGMRPARRLGC